MLRCSTVLSRGWRGPTGRHFVFKGVRRRARAPTISATCSTASRSRSKMPKRTDIKSILIIGAGPIVIGQACEFDYSGAQACKVLREEGYRVVLVNSNPATIMTDPQMADATYIEPITWQVVARIIEKELLIEESVIGWKEFEMEVVRDREDNCIIVCSIENLDPMGVHTGDSITVAPSQTLTDKEYQILRDASIAVLREIGVDTGGSNVQFAINPDDGRMLGIEMNPRVSR